MISVGVHTVFTKAAPINVVDNVQASASVAVREPDNVQASASAAAAAAGGSSSSSSVRQKRGGGGSFSSVGIHARRPSGDTAGVAHTDVDRMVGLYKSIQLTQGFLFWFSKFSQERKHFWFSTFSHLFVYFRSRRQDVVRLQQPLNL
jgi:hypothetical protein